MKKLYILFYLFVFIILIFTISIFKIFVIALATDTNNKYIYKENNIIEFTKDYHIYLDSEKSKEKIVNIDFDNYNINPPKECLQKMSVCEETTDIHIITKKTWRVIRLDNISSKKLDPVLFAKYYPNIKSKNIINDGSPLQDKLITQRILYDRGLLNIEPTGKIGWLTEIAIMKLQHLKGIKEYDEKKGIVYIGPKTIKELNALKDRMKDPNYLKNNPLPNINVNDFDENFKKRLNEIQNMINKTSPNQNELYKNAINSSNVVIPPIKPEYLKFEGRAKILKQETTER